MTDKSEPSFLQTDPLPGQASTELTPDQSLKERLREIVGQIELGMGCVVRTGMSRKGRFVQIKCYRKDVITGKMGWGYGGKGFPSEFATRNEIVQMIFGLYKGYWEHEARENFQYRGRRVYGPHMDVDAIWEIANRVDVRSLKHVDDKEPELTPQEQKIVDSGVNGGRPLHEQLGTVRLGIVSPFATNIQPADVPQIPWPATEDEVLKLYMSNFREGTEITPRREERAAEIFARATQLAAEGIYDRIVPCAGRRISLMKEYN